MDVPFLLLHIVGSIVCTPLQLKRDGLLPILSEKMSEIDKLSFNSYFEWDPWCVHPYKRTDVKKIGKVNLNGYSRFQFDPWCVHPRTENLFLLKSLAIRHSEILSLKELDKWNSYSIEIGKLNLNGYSRFQLDKWNSYWIEWDPWCVHPYKRTDVKKIGKVNLNGYSRFQFDPWCVHPRTENLLLHKSLAIRHCEILSLKELDKWNSYSIEIGKLNLNGYSCFQLDKWNSYWIEWDPWCVRPNNWKGVNSLSELHKNLHSEILSLKELDKWNNYWIELEYRNIYWIELDKFKNNGYSCFEDYSQSSKECVGKCQTSSEYKKITLETCADVCGMEDGNCAHHCLCDSSKARLVECCAKPEILFEYSNSHHKLPRITYCYHETTLMTETTGMNGRDSQQVRSLQNWFTILLFAVVGIIVAFVILPKCGIYPGTLSFASFIFPCAGATELGSGQRDHQDHSQIFPTSLKYVSKCPNFSEYMNKTSEKCVDVCKSWKDGNCAYHCMRDSSKTTLVEFCAKPKILFDYCPEFDPVHQTIQKDQTTLCNPKLSLHYYNSSNIYFCDPKNCLHLSTSSDRSGQTTLSALMTGTTEMNGGEIQEVGSLQNWILILLSVVVVIFVASVIVFILRRFGIFSVCPRNKHYHYQEDVEYK